ncbi:MAG: FtsX-like permease family protein, partial [Candidatus Heimdallarchaeaceae archaeon]
MIGQIKFAWISFRRSFSSSFPQVINLLLTYTSVSMSINIFFSLKEILYFTIPYTFYRAYLSISIIFVILALIIGTIVTIKTAQQKFNTQKKDIALMKNIGSKSSWIYSYIMFYHMIMGALAFLVGLFLSGLILMITLYSFNLAEYTKYIKFVPAFGLCIFILIVHYIKTHNEIMQFLEEKDFIKSSKGLSEYKSIFELDDIIKKLKASVKLGVKNYIRSGEILSTLFYLFLLSSGVILFFLGPLTIGSTLNHQFEMQYDDISYIVGSDAVANFYQENFEIQEYNKEEQFKLKNVIDLTFIDELGELGLKIDKLFLNKLRVDEINVTIPNPSATGGYSFIGMDRSINATIVGYSNTSIFDERFIRGSPPDTSKNEVVIGESLDHYLFENSTQEHMKIEGISGLYSISGVIRDNFASGFTVYIPINKLKQKGITTGANCIQVNEIDEAKADDLIQFVETNNYKILNIQKLMQEQKKKLVKISALGNSFGSLLLIITLFRFTVFGILYVRSYYEDSALMYKIGVKKRKIYTSFNTAVLLHTVPGTFVGYFFSSIFIRYFTINNFFFPLFIPLIFCTALGIIGLVIVG